MRRYNLIAAICDCMLTLGWGPYQNDHEDANGQFEMNWTYADALTTADRHAFFKYMVKSLAERAGMRATFMPKPFAGLSGNGCHVHVSAWDAAADNLFHDPDGELGLSRTAYQFIAGLLQNAEAVCALTNPTVNSFKRINGATTLSGATWSPNAISYTGNNRTHMIRIPDRDRFELRLPRRGRESLPAAGRRSSPLASTASPTSGRRESASTTTCTTHPLPAGDARRLPTNLLDALRALRTNKELGAGRWERRSSTRSRSSRKQSGRSTRPRISPWERRSLLDC